ncbi:ACP S-malonyltransferase [Miniphocaeibacter massiliensis]|uniref:ACP S-malonyltransferase n=1 Tax=Miniphocaeibacter massiliensis TaxID=2041841 RepID=UPI000C1C0828|nr:ACP S-malonyltransferase [Miniphocaeibacter massiliensis]
MKLGFLYGGQGSQQEKMGYDLYEKFNEVKDFYDSINLGFDVKDYSFNKDLKIISETKYTQPIMVAFQIAVTKILKDNDIVPEYVAGLSIGEYSALVAANVLEPLDAIEIAEKRGISMEQAGEGIDTGMVAIMGLDTEIIDKVVKETSDEKDKVEIANLNCPGQVVISGEVKKVEEAVGKLKEVGARRAIPLNVSGPFHTSYMEPVSKELHKLFKNYEFKEEEIPVVYNLLGNVKTDEDIKEIMEKQVKSSVKFQESIEYMISQGVDTFIEIGFGDVIKGFLKKIDRKLKVHSANSIETINALKEELNNGK